MPLSDLSPDEQAQLDQRIFDGNRLGAIQFLREALGVTLHQAIDQLVARYDELRKTHNDRFRESESEYWKGFNS